MCALGGRGWEGGGHHHPVAMHLQGYTHHCCITRRLCPPSPPRPPCRRSGDSDTVHLQLSLSFSLCVCVRACVCARLGLLEISAVDRGVISLYGVRSELFVGMNSRGKLYGTVSFPRPPVCEHARACPSISLLHGRMSHIERGLTLRAYLLRCGGDAAERLFDKTLFYFIHSTYLKCLNK